MRYPLLYILIYLFIVVFVDFILFIDIDIDIDITVFIRYCCLVIIMIQRNLKRAVPYSYYLTRSDIHSGILLLRLQLVSLNAKNVDNAITMPGPRAGLVIFL